jgi:hypothetical protein
MNALFAILASLGMMLHSGQAMTKTDFIPINQLAFSNHSGILVATTYDCTVYEDGSSWCQEW